MKMKFMLLFLVLLAIPICVKAGDVQVVDFNYTNDTIVILGEKDMVRFDLYGDQKVMVRDIGNDGNSVALTVFVEGAELPNYISLDQEHSIKVDFQRDNIDDLMIELVSVNENNNSTMLKLQRLSFGDYARNEPEEVNDNKVKSFFGKWYNTGKDYFWKAYNKTKQNYLVAGIIVILVLLLVLLNRRWIRRKYRRLKLAFI